MIPVFSVRVRYFARARDIVGADEVIEEVPYEPTVGQLRQTLKHTYPALAGLLERSAIAVNHDFAEDARRLAPGDEVAVIPPVSGG